MVQGLYGQCVERHRIYVSDRGGARRFAELVDISSVRWTRMRDNTSDATIIIAGAACEAQATTLAKIEPRRHELLVYRGKERVWEGPINLITYYADRVEIHAQDVSEYIMHRPLSVEWDNRESSEDGVVATTVRLRRIIRYELANQMVYEDDDGNARALPGWEQMDPPANVRPHLVIHNFANEVKTAARTTAYQMTVGEHLDNYARTGGIDWTVVGRAIHIWDTNRSIGSVRTLTEADFFSNIITSLYGSEYASAAFAVANDGRYGGAGGKKTDWRWNEKTAPNGSAVTVEPEDAEPIDPSVVDWGVGEWNGYRYWMAYTPTNGTATMRVAGSNNLETWNDIRGEEVDDDDDGTPLAGNDPTLAIGYSEHLWLFYVSGGALWRTRSEDGIDWTEAVELNTISGIREPSLTYRPESKTWVLYYIDTSTTTYTVKRMTSGGRQLTGTGAFSNAQDVTLNNAPSGKHPARISAHRQGSSWLALITFTDSGTFSDNGVVYAATASTSSPTVFTVADDPTLPGVSNSIGRADFVWEPDGTMPILYSVDASPHEIRLSELTGPLPVVEDGDVNIDYYGPWADIYTVEDEDDEDVPTQAELNSQARRNLTGRSPVPLIVRVPDNSGIRLASDLTINHLVPGIRVPLLATLNARPFSQVQKLDSVTVTETSDGETIQVTLLPASTEDSDEEEE